MNKSNAISLRRLETISIAENIHQNLPWEDHTPSQFVEHCIVILKIVLFVENQWIVDT